MINAHTIWEPKDMSSYQEDWEKLHASSNNEPSTSYSWTKALFTCHLRPQDQFFIIRLSDNKHTICFLPMVATTEKLLGMPLLTIYPISERYNTHSDIIGSLNSTDLVTALITELNNLPIKWDVFRITRLLEDNPFLNSMEHTVKKYFSYILSRHEQPSFFLELPDTYSQYLARRSSKFRNYLNRMNKKLSKSGAVEFIKFNNHEDFSDAFKTIVQIESASWKQSHGTAISAVKRQEDFYKTLCEGENKTGQLHLTFLHIDKQPIAYNMGLINNDFYYYLKTSYDSKYRSSSPSTILRARLIESLISDKIRFFDFPGEPYEWEQQWTTDLRWHKSLVMFNRTFKARLFALLSLLNRKLKKQSDDKILQYCNPRDLRPPTE